MIEHTVTRVLGVPYFIKYVWCVDVETDAGGSVQKTTVYCATKEEALQVTIGYKFAA